MKTLRSVTTIFATWCLFLAVFGSTALAQAPDGSWEKIGAITFTSLARQSPSTITASTSHGYIYYSHDEGLAWEHRFFNDTLDLVDIAWVDSLHGAVLEKTNSVYFTSDGGVTWDRSQLPLSFTLLTRLSYPSIDTLYTCDGNGRIFRTTDHGTQWTVYQTPDTFGLNLIYFLDSKTGFAGGGGTDSNFFETTDAGMTWTCHNLPNAGDSMEFYCIDFRGRNTGIVGGSGCYWITTDGGKNWTFHAVPASAHASLYVARFINDSTFFAMGPEGQYYYSSDHGQTMIAPGILPDGKRSYNVVLVEGQASISGALFDPFHGATAVGGYGLVYHSSNAQDWTVLNDCAFNKGYSQVFGSDIILVDNYGILVRSMDGGRSWHSSGLWDVGYDLMTGHIDTLRIGNTTGMRFTSPDTGLVFTQGRTLSTTNGGQTWDSVGDTRAMSGVSFYGKFGYGVGDVAAGMQFSTTTDGGFTWRCDTVPKDMTSPFPKAKPYFSSFSQSPFALDSMYGYALRYRIDTDESQAHYYNEVYRTTDGGRSWFGQPNPRGLWLHSIYFRNRNIGYLCGNGGKLYRTNDGGLTWDTIQLATTNNVYAIQFLNDSLGFLAAFTKGGDSHWNFITTDGGATWKDDSVRYPHYDGGYILLSNLFFQSNSLIAASYGIYKRNWYSSSASVRTELWNLGTYLWIDNYPSPAENHFHCRLSGMWSNPGAHLSAEMYDILGRNVMDLTDLANWGNNGSTSEFDISTASLAAGVYSIKYTLGEYSHQRLVVVVR